MARLTITLSDRIHRALKEASAERNRTIGELIEESLESYGIRSREEAAAIVARVEPLRRSVPRRRSGWRLRRRPASGDVDCRC